MTVHVSPPAAAAPQPLKAPTETDRRVGARIRTIRASLGLSQTALGAAIGVTFQQVQKYEKGLNRISAGKLVEIAQRLGVPHAELLGPAGQEPATAGLTRAAISLGFAFDRLPAGPAKTQLRGLVFTLAGEADRATDAEA